MTRGIVVCAQPLAAEAGWKILESGGNAVDAAVAAALVQAIVDPLNASLGGFGVAQVRAAGSRVARVISFHARAPLAARPDMFKPVGEVSLDPLASGTYRVRDDTNQIGYLSVGVPGTVAGLAELLSRHGSMDWLAVSVTATRLCLDGWTVTAEHYADWSRAVPASRIDGLTRLAYSSVGRAVYTADGSLRKPGDRVINPEYATTMRMLAADGAHTFYEGELAARIAEDFEQNGGLLRAVDLAGYRAEVTAALEVEYRGFRVTSAPPPAGGLAVLEILRLLERHDVRALGWGTPAFVQALAAAMRLGFAHFRDHVGDPDFVDVPVARLLVSAGAEPDVDAAGARGSREPEETTHLCVADEHGTCVSLTHTLGAASGVITPGLGFLYNGAMHRFDPVPGHPNSIAPGKRRTTGIAPTIVWRGDEPILLVGAAGGNSIVGGVVQVIINVLDFGMDALAAVSAPRIHCEGDVVSLEARFPSGLAASLGSMGEKVVVVPSGYDRAVAASVQAITTPAWDRPGAGPDPRQAGVAMGTMW